MSITPQRDNWIYLARPPRLRRRTAGRLGRPAHARTGGEHSTRRRARQAATGKGL